MFFFEKKNQKTFVCLITLACASTAHAETAYEIPVILSLTGNGAFLGNEEHESLKLAEKVFNAGGGIHGHPIHFDAHDDQSVPQTDVQIGADLLAQHPTVILGPSITADCAAFAPLMKNGPVDYCFAAAYHPAKGSYVFAAGVSTRDQMAALVRFFRLRGLTRIALATTTDATGQDGDAGFNAVLKLPENASMQSVEQIHYAINDVSVAAQIERIKSANPQAVIIWSLGSAFGTILRGLLQSGLDIPVGTTAGNMTYAQMQQFAAYLPKQLYFASPAWPAGSNQKVTLPPGIAAKQKDFYRAFQQAGLKADEGSLLAWDPAIIIVDALRRLPAGATAAQLRTELLNVSDQAGVGGIYNFVDKEPQNGLSITDLLVSQWDVKSENWIPTSQLGGLPLPE